MPYVLAGVIVSIAVVLFIFTGVWGGLIWVAIAAAIAAVAFMGSARSLRRARTEPTGVTRSQTGSGTANERVGQS